MTRRLLVLAQSFMRRVPKTSSKVQLADDEAMMKGVACFPALLALALLSRCLPSRLPSHIHPRRLLRLAAPALPRRRAERVQGFPRPASNWPRPGFNGTVFDHQTAAFGPQTVCASVYTSC